MTARHTVDAKPAKPRFWTALLLLSLAFAPACAHQKSEAEKLKDAEAQAAVNAAIARGDLECRTETHANSKIPERVCYFRGERDKRSISSSNPSRARGQ